MGGVCVLVARFISWKLEGGICRLGLEGDGDTCRPGGNGGVVLEFLASLLADRLAGRYTSFTGLGKLLSIFQELLESLGVGGCLTISIEERYSS